MGQNLVRQHHRRTSQDILSGTDTEYKDDQMSDIFLRIITEHFIIKVFIFKNCKFIQNFIKFNKWLLSILVTEKD